MPYFRNILAIYNGAAGSEAVLEQAVTIARASGARLTLLKQLGTGDSAGEARKRLKRLVPWIVQQGVVKIESEVTADRSHREIVRQVREKAHDLVILSTEGGLGFKNVLLSDPGTSLMRTCPCPVWVLRPEQPTPCTRIVAAVGSDGEPNSDTANAWVVALAAALAQTHDAELHFVHPWSPTGKDAELLTNEISDETREGIIRQNEAACRSAINRLLSRYFVSGLDHQIHIPRGLPQQAVVGLARRLDADVVVMGSTSQAGISGFFLGNPAETVFGAAGCSVLTVKADTMEAPLPPVREQEAPRARMLSVGGR